MPQTKMLETQQRRTDVFLTTVKYKNDLKVVVQFLPNVSTQILLA